MKDLQLIAIIEVPEDKKVICQSEGCGRSVYKSVHIVRINRKIKILGSECFKKYIGKFRSSEQLKPMYGSSNGISLSEYERDLLLKNTEQLISEFESKYANIKESETGNEIDYSNLSDIDLQELALKITRDNFRKNKGLNPDLPGWAGWIQDDAKSLYKQLKESQKLPNYILSDE